MAGSADVERRVRGGTQTLPKGRNQNRHAGGQSDGVDLRVSEGTGGGGHGGSEYSQSHRRKTDKIDVKLLCELLRLNALPHPVHMPSQSRELRGILVALRKLIQARSKLSNVVRGMLRQDGIRLTARRLNTFKAWKGLLQGSYKSAHLPLVLNAYLANVAPLSQTRLRSLFGLRRDPERDSAKKR